MVFENLIQEFILRNIGPTNLTSSSSTISSQYPNVGTARAAVIVFTIIFFILLISSVRSSKITSGAGRLSTAGAVWVACGVTGAATGVGTGTNNESEANTVKSRVIHAFLYKNQ